MVFPNRQVKGKITVVRGGGWVCAFVHQPLARFKLTVARGPVQGHAAVLAPGVIRIHAALVDEKLARLDMPATGGPHESVAPEGVLLDHGIPTFLDGFLHAVDVPARG